MATSDVQSKSVSFFSEVAATSSASPPSPWPALHVPRAAIDDEIGRLCDLARRPGERRAAEIVHPLSRESFPGVTPGLSVSINVVLPGETLIIPRDNASRVEFCIRGAGSAAVADNSLSMGKFDAWTVPSMATRQYRGEGGEPLVWLSYSNAPMLQRLDILYSDLLASPAKQPIKLTSAERKYVRENAPDFPVLDDGARLRGYEYLVDIEVVDNQPLIWPWSEVRSHLSTEQGDGKRSILLLYNPATGARNGTTQSFFATLSSFPAGKEFPAPPRGHKHTSFACNYHFLGAGHSIVDGQPYEWEAGDFMLSAPSWAEHAHGSSAIGSSVLTVQDHPLQIGLESLVWQERVDGPILTLGREPGVTGYVGPRLAGD